MTAAGLIVAATAVASIVLAGYVVALVRLWAVEDAAHRARMRDLG